MKVTPGTEYILCPRRRFCEGMVQILRGSNRENLCRLQMASAPLYRWQKKWRCGDGRQADLRRVLPAVRRQGCLCDFHGHGCRHRRGDRHLDCLSLRGCPQVLHLQQKVLPRTDDPTRNGLWAALCLISLGGMTALGLRKQNRTPADQLETLCVPGSPDRVSGFRLPAAAQSVTGGDGTDVL